MDRDWFCPYARTPGAALGDAARRETAMDAVLNIEQLRKRFGRQEVLCGVSLRVQAGEFFGLVGVNGAGKTTLIKCLLNFCDVDGGRITIHGVAHDAKGARERLAFLPERFVPPYYLRGADFLRYMARLQGVVPAAAEVEAMLAALDLDPSALAKPVRSLSKGMAQKLGLAATLLCGKDLLVLDEPMSGLDPKASALFKQKLRGLKSQGRTLFFSTHTLSDVEMLCDRMAVLHAGEVRFIGSPEECRARYAADSLEAAYLRCVDGTA